MSQDELSNRLKEMVKQLVYVGVIRNQREFGEKLGYKPAFTSQILSGHKLPNDLPNKIRQTFGEEWNIETFQPQQKPTPSEAGTIPADPQMPGIYQRIIDELIESSKAQRKASEAMAEISKALLEERQLIRDTASAAIDLAKKAKSGDYVSKKDFDATVRFVEQSVEDDHVSLTATQELLLDHVAQSRGIDRDAVVLELGKKILAETKRRDTEQNTSRLSNAVRS